MNNLTVISRAHQLKKYNFLRSIYPQALIKQAIKVIGCGVLLCGCSIYEAAHAPPSVDYKKVNVGLTRAETISILGIPKLTDNKEKQKTDTFEFLDGIHGASKARIILYLAGDIFTAGLSELIFWPIEANAFDGKQCRGTVSYNANDRVTGYNILDSDGDRLWVSGTNPMLSNEKIPVINQVIKQAPTPYPQNIPVTQAVPINQPVIEDTAPSYQNYQQPQSGQSGTDLRHCLSLVSNEAIAKCVRKGK